MKSRIQPIGRCLDDTHPAGAGYCINNRDVSHNPFTMSNLWRDEFDDVDLRFVRSLPFVIIFQPKVNGISKMTSHLNAGERFK